MNMKRKSIRILDGPVLSYLEGGTGRPLLMLHGWSQSATGFSGQYEKLCETRRVIAPDWRGHGESEKPETGYRICRFAKDLVEFLDALSLTDFDVLCHSLGASVFWAYLSMFGKERPPQKVIFIDEPAALLARPDWNEQVRREAGAIIASLEVLANFTNSVRDADTVAAHAEILRPMFTNSYPEEKLFAVAKENLKFPRSHAAVLLADNCLQDWRSVVREIDKEVLVVAAEASPHPLDSQIWIANQIKGAELEIFAETEGGSHFMFLENPDRFNIVLTRFLNGSGRG